MHLFDLVEQAKNCNQPPHFALGSTPIKTERNGPICTVLKKQRCHPSTQKLYANEHRVDKSWIKKHR